MAYTLWRPKGDLLPRTITGLIAIPAVVFIILQGSIFFQILGVAIAFGLLREWSNLSFSTPYHWQSCICFASVLLGFFTHLKIVAFLLPIVGCAWLMYSNKLESKKYGIISLGYLYIAGAAATLIHIMPMFGTKFTLVVLSLIWGVDTGAFLVGKTIGGPKLATSISPNKTWSGFVGGIVFGILSVKLLATATNFEMTNNLWLFAVISVFLAQIGDLLESWCKRYFKVKDSGNFLPGHGGILDRLDSLLAVSFVIAILWHLGN